MLDNIASGLYWNHKETEGDYWVLSLEPRKAGFGAGYMLTETAITDSQVFEQVVLVLREQGIPVRETTGPQVVTT